MRGGKNEVKIAGYVLAGGRSTRFGRDKALVKVGGSPMLERMMELLESVASPVNVVAAPNKYDSSGMRIVKDRWPGQGPLGGILTALHYTKATSECAWNLIVACDTPFLTHEWLAFLSERARVSKAQVVIPRSANGLEPLCACWRTDGTPPLQEQFDIGVRKVTEAVKPLKLEVLDEKDWNRFDIAERLFWNMNTQADYEEAQRMFNVEGK
jgi:molybdenum cofactor guanylyltransferase